MYGRYLKDNTQEMSVPVRRLSRLPAGRVGLLREDHMSAFKRQAARRAQSSAKAAVPRSLATLDAKSSVASGGGSSGRRQRCRQCEGCLRPDCGRCRLCLDRPKFGGPGNLRQACALRVCTQVGMGSDGSARAELSALRRKSQLGGDVRSAPDIARYRDALAGLSLDELSAEAQWWVTFMYRYISCESC